MSELISQNAYAKSRKSRGLKGGSAEAVRKAIASGRISLINGKIDADVADLQWKRRTLKAGDSGSDPKTTDDGGDINDARLAEIRAKTLLLDIEIAEKRGELVNAKAAGDAVFLKARQARDALMAIPGRLSSRLTDDARLALNTEIRRVCEQLAGPPVLPGATTAALGKPE